MTEIVEMPIISVAAEEIPGRISPQLMKGKPAARSKPNEMNRRLDPERFLRTAKELVVSNYNEYRDPSRSPELSMDSVHIVWFSKTLNHWKAVVASPIVRGLIWEVTYNGLKREAYLDIYKKLNNVKIQSVGDN